MLENIISIVIILVGPVSIVRMAMLMPPKTRKTKR